MQHTAKPHELLWVYSMGKRFRVRAIATTTEEANTYMDRHPGTALIALLGEFAIIANVYEGLRDEDRQEETQTKGAKQ